MIFNLMKPVPVQTATMYLYGREADKTVTYNGVELPELPDWDKETYPYAYILLGDDNAYYFRYKDTKIEVGNGGIITNSTIDYHWYKYDSSEWKPLDAYFGNLTVIWCNTDCYYKQWGVSDGLGGTLYLSATDPVTTYTNADVTINGVGYVGAVLPKLPEWDKEQYPYAVIQIGEDVHSFMISTVPLYYKKTSEDICGRENGTSWEYLLSDNPNNYFGGVPGEWTRVKEPFEIEKDSYIYDFVSWSNYDILNADSTIYLSASDPIPVYE